MNTVNKSLNRKIWEFFKEYVGGPFHPDADYGVHERDFKFITGFAGNSFCMMGIVELDQEPLTFMRVMHHVTQERSFTFYDCMRYLEQFDHTLGMHMMGGKRENVGGFYTSVEVLEKFPRWMINTTQDIRNKPMALQFLPDGHFHYVVPYQYYKERHWGMIFIREQNRVAFYGKDNDHGEAE